jgi:hypothetical protein
MKKAVQDELALAKLRDTLNFGIELDRMADRLAIQVE